MRGILTVFAALVAAPGSAATVTVTDAYSYDPAAIYSHVSYAGALGALDAPYTPVGRLKLTLADASLLYSYCVDLFASTATGVYTLGAIGDVVADPVRGANLLSLLSHNPNPANTDEGAALQLAVWDLVYDDDFDVLGGAFRSFDDSPYSLAGAQALANSYLDNVRLGNWTPVAGYSLTSLHLDYAQDQITLVAGVPEPASWAMLIAGFGVLGGLARRRRKAALA